MPTDTNINNDIVRWAAPNADDYLTIGAGYPQLLQEVLSGETALGTRIELGGFQMVYGGGVAQDSQVNAGLLSVWGGGLTIGTTVNDRGTLQLTAGGQAENVTINAGGYLMLAADAVLSGTLTLSGAVQATAPVDATGLTIIADLTGRQHDDGFFLDNLSLFSGAVGLTLTVDPLQETGLYALVSGAAGFTAPILVIPVGQSDGVTLAAGEFVTLGDRHYRLVAAGTDLTLEIQPVVALDGPAITADCTTPTRFAVTITVDFDSRTSIRQYSFNGTDWLNYTGSIEVNANVTLLFHSMDERGNSVDGIYAITNIDTVLPELQGVPLTAIDAYAARVSWTAATDNVAVTGYELEVNGTVYAVSALDYTLSDLAVGDYTYSLRARDAAGNWSAWSAAQTFTVADVTIPVWPSLPTAAVDAYSAVIAWTAATDNIAVTGYELEINGTVYAVSALDYTLSDLAVGDYTYSLRARDAAGNWSAWSAEQTFTVADVTVPALLTPPTAVVDAYSALLSWTAATDNVAVTGYELEINGTVYAVSALDYALSDLAVGDYTYSLRARDAAGNWSAWSAEQTFTVADVTVPALLTPPTAVVDAYSALLSWTAATDNVAVTGYELEINGTVYAVSALDYALSDLAVGDYSYSLRAVDAAGNWSAWSTEQTFTVADVTIPALPAVPTATVDAYSALLSWTAATDNVAVTGYELEINDTVYAVSALDYTLSDLVVGDYSYRLRARDAAGNWSAWSAEQTFTVADVTVPALPTLPTAAVDAYSAMVSWTAATDNIAVTGYELEINGTVYAVSALDYALSALAVGDYTYSLRAGDAAGNWSGWSAEQTFTVVDVTVPALPAVPTAAVDAYSALLSWTAATDNVAVTGYELEINGTVYAVSALDYALSDLAVGDYTYSLRARDAAGNWSAWSAEQTFTVADVTIPALLTPPTAVVDAYSALLSWTAATDNVAVTGYELEVNGTVHAVSALDYALSDLAVGDYSYRLRAVDAAGNWSDWSTEQTFTVADVTIPALPAVPTAVVDAYSALLSWPAATDNVAVTGYELEINGTVYAVSALDYTLSDLVVGDYSYRLRARDAVGNWSAWSAEQTFTVADVTIPALPAVPTAVVDAYSALLSWPAATDNVAVTGYELEINGTVYAVSALDYALSDLAVGDYSYRLRARDAAENWSAWSAEQTFTVADVTVPALLTPPTAVVDAYAARVSWTAATDNVAVTGYELEINGTVYAVSVLDYTLSDLAVGDYSYRLRARDAAENWSAWSAEQTFTVADVTVPALPAVPTAVVDAYSALLSWTAATDNVAVTGYELEVNGTVYAVSALDYTLSDLVVGDYSYRLRARDAAENWSAWSAEQTFTVADVTIPALPAVPTAVVDAYSAVIAWTAATDNIAVTGYELEINGTVYAVSALDYTLSDLVVGDYSYRLRARDAAGNWSAWSAAQTFTVTDVTIPALPAVPTAVVDAYSALLSWPAATDNVAVTGYELEINGTVYAVSALDYALSDLAVGDYTYSLRAGDAAGNWSDWSAEQTFTVVDVTVPTQPSDLTIAVEETTGTVTLTWQASADNVGVTAYAVTVAGVTHTVTDGTRLVITGLDYGRYQAVIRARDAAGNWSVTTAPVPFQVTDGFSPELNGNPTAAVDGTAVTVSWEPATDNVGVTGYEIAIDGVIYRTANTSLDKNGLNFGWHTYQVRALDADNNTSFWSDELTFWVDDYFAPVLTGSPEVELQEYDALFTWAAATDNDQIAGYILKLNGNEYDLGQVLQFTNENLAPGDYQWQLAAYDPAGHRSDWSTAQTLHVLDVTAPAAPGSPTVQIDGYQVAFSWNAPVDNVGVATYRLEIDGQQIDIDTATHFSRTIETIGPHSFRVQARDSAGNWSAWSDAAEFAVADVSVPLLSPIFSAAVDAYSVTFDWQPALDNVGVTGYELKVNDTVYAVDALGHTLNNLAAGAYSYRLRARDAAGNWSVWSAEKEIAVVDVTAPLLPLAPQAMVQGNDAQVSWTAATDNVGVTGYELEVNGAVYAVDALEYALSDLAVGAYNYRLRARDAAANWGVWSEVQTFSVLDVSAPTLNGQPLAQVDGRQLNFTWTAASDDIGVTGYILRLNGADYLLGNVTAWQFNDVAAGYYEYSLLAFDGQGNVSVWSVPQQLSVTTYQGEPTDGEVSGTVTLSLGVVALAPGSYFFAGEFAAGLNARITLASLDTGRDVGRTDVKNGVLQPLKNNLLLQGDYELFITSRDRGKTGGAVSVSLQGTQFSLANMQPDDDPATAPIAVYSGQEPAVQDWVGFGDTIDYRRIALDHSGSYDFHLDGLENPAKLTVYVVNPLTGALKSLKSVSVTPKVDRAGNLLNSGGIYGLLLDVGLQYCLSIEATKASKGENTPYELSIGGERFDHADASTTDNDWQNPALPVFAAVPGAEWNNRWVGYGDETDFCRLELAASGRYNFTLSGLENALDLAIYQLDPVKGTLKQLKKVTIIPKTDRNGTLIDFGGLDGLLLDSSQTYYLGVTAKKASKGLGSRYDLSVGGTQFNHPDSTLADNAWQNPDLPTLTAAGDTLENGWIGYGDPIDFRQLSLDYAGVYNVTIQGLTDTAKLTIFELNPERGTLKSIKNVTVTPKFDRAGVWQDSATIAGLLLDSSKTYYISAEVPKADKGYFTGYGLQLSGTEFNQDISAADNAWDSGGVGWLNLQAGGDIARDRWVGFGDPVDVFRFAVAESQAGQWLFDLNLETDKAAKMTVYRIVNGKLSKVSLRNAGADLIAGDYAVEIKSADSGKGKKNTAYDLAVYTPVAAAPAPGAGRSGWLA